LEQKNRLWSLKRRSVSKEAVLIRILNPFDTHLLHFVKSAKPHKLGIFSPKRGIKFLRSVLRYLFSFFATQKDKRD